MKYSPDELLNILQNVISEKKVHANYSHVVALAKLCRQIMTGNDQNELIVSYKTRETTEQKEQRIHLYNSRTAYVSNKVLSQFKEVERADNTVDNIWYENEGPESKTLLTELNERIKAYSGTKNIKRYLHDAVRRLNFFDPNAWLVTEFRTKNDKDKPYPYPLEIYSDQAVMYEKEFGVTNYLVGKWPIKYKIREGSTIKEKDGSKFTIYGPMVAFTMTEAGEAKEAMQVDGAEYVTLLIDNKSIVYRLDRYETKFEETPAIQIGYKSDPETNWVTFVSPLHPAIHILRDLINTKSEYDLHKAMHGFAQKFAYAERCTFKGNTGNAIDICDNGTLRISRSQCPACKGTGKMVHTTVQDVVVIAKPENGGDQVAVKLNEMVHFVEIPQHIIAGHKQDIKDLENDVSLAIFNANVFDRKEIAITATEKKINMQSVYNEYSDFADNLSEVYKKKVQLAANVIDGMAGLIVDFSIPKDYRMETIDEILQQRKLAMESGSPYDIINAFDMGILMKQNQDNKIYIDQIRSQEQFRPWRDKSKEEIMFILSGVTEFDPDRILYMYFDKIFTKVWADPAFMNFHKMKYTAQKVIVDKEVELIINEKKLLAPEIIGFTDALNNNPNPVTETEDDNIQ